MLNGQQAEHFALKPEEMVFMKKFILPFALLTLIGSFGFCDDNIPVYSPLTYTGDRDFFAAVYGVYEPEGISEEQKFYPKSANIFQNIYKSPVEYYKIKDVLYKEETEITLQDGKIDTKILQLSVFAGKGTLTMGALILSGLMPESADSDWCMLKESDKIRTANAINKSLLDILQSDELYAKTHDRAIHDLKYVSLIVQRMNDVAFEDFSDTYLKNTIISFTGNFSNLKKNQDQRYGTFKYLAGIDFTFSVQPAKYYVSYTPIIENVSIDFLSNSKALVQLEKGTAVTLNGRIVSIEKGQDDSSLLITMVDPE